MGKRYATGEAIEWQEKAVEKKWDGLAGWFEAFDVRCGSITFADLPWRAE